MNLKMLNHQWNTFNSTYGLTKKLNRFLFFTFDFQMTFYNIKSSHFSQFYQDGIKQSKFLCFAQIILYLLYFLST